MSSPQQIDANRTNGRLGGVKTKAGKDKSKLNSLKHGLSSSLPVLNAYFYQQGEMEYEEHKKRITDQENPQDGYEEFQVNQIIEGKWKLHCFSLLQKHIMNQMFINNEISGTNSSIRVIMYHLYNAKAKLLVIEKDQQLLKGLRKKQLPWKAIEGFQSLGKIIKHKAFSLKINIAIKPETLNDEIWKYAEINFQMTENELSTYCAEELEKYRLEALEKERKIENEFEIASKILDHFYPMGNYLARLEERPIYLAALQRMDRVTATVAKAYDKLYSYRKNKNSRPTFQPQNILLEDNNESVKCEYTDYSTQ